MAVTLQTMPEQDPAVENPPIRQIYQCISHPSLDLLIPVWKIPHPILNLVERKKQRVHVTVSESHTETITAPRITTGDAPPADAPTTDESDSGHRSHASNPRTRPPPMEVVNRAASASERPRPAPSPERPRGEEPARETVTDPAMPPPSTINHELRPWTGAEDHELISYKSDARAGPACKTIGQRLRRAPESCRARGIWLKQSRPDLNSRTEPEAED
jgi:hypothetical protein